MEDKLNYLKKYHRDVEIVQDGIADIEHIPDSWKRLFNFDRTEDRIRALLPMWRGAVGQCLSNTIQYLQRNLRNIELITYRGKYSLLYSVASPNGEILYYEGGNPLNAQLPSELEKYWAKLPETVQKFYNNLHDGFNYYASGSMGLYSKSDILCLGDEEWGIIESMEEPLKIQLESSFGFFGNGMGAYVVIDALKCQADNAALWYTSQLPRYDINFWDIVDEWIVIGFQA